MDNKDLRGYNPDRRSLEAFTVTLLTCTTVVVAARLCVPWRAGRKWMPKDSWMLVAAISFVAMSSISIVCARLNFKVRDLLHQPLTVESVQTIFADGTVVTKLVFALTLLHWVTLWGVKFSLLALYWKVMSTPSSNKVYRYLWIGNCLVSLLMFIGTMLANFFVCGSDVSKVFRVGDCVDRASVRNGAISLWIGFSCDVLTTIAILCAPTYVIWNCQISKKQKATILGIMGLAVVCIAVSVCRIVEVNLSVRSRNILQINHWIFWSILEGSIGIVIGSCSGFYELLKVNGRQQQRAPSTPSFVKTDLLRKTSDIEMCSSHREGSVISAGASEMRNVDAHWFAEARLRFESDSSVSNDNVAIVDERFAKDEPGSRPRYV